MTEKPNINPNQIIRYSFIIVIYNFLLACIAYVADWINDNFFQYSAANWDFISFWLFISVCILIGGFMLYAAPFFERWLNYKLEKWLKKLASKAGEAQNG